MHASRVAIACCALLACAGRASGQAEYRVYEEHPRLFLDAGRLARLSKEVDRQSVRWRALRAHVDAGTVFPEQPLVDALRFQVEGSEVAGERAVEWSRQQAEDGIATAFDLRLAALVYDWCHQLFDSGTRATVRNAMAGAVAEVLPQAGLDPGLVRAAILASIALAGDWEGSEAALSDLLGTHWENEIRPALEIGGLSDDGATLIAILEASLAVRRNLETDLLRPASQALAGLVRTRLLAYYPLDIETSEGLARRPSRFGTDQRLASVQAPLYRIADMLLVAYESNLREFQFLQGLVHDDRYLLRSPMAVPYELLWVNPYLPGLTPQSAPTLAHDPVRGRLYARVGWQRPSTWIGYTQGRLQVLAGEELSATEDFDSLTPMYFPDAAVVPVVPPAKVVLAWQGNGENAPATAAIYFIGLQEGETYSLRVGGREARLVQAGAGGIFVLRSDANARKRDRIDLRNKVRLELRHTLKPTDPGRPRPSLNR